MFQLLFIILALFSSSLWAVDTVSDNNSWTLSLQFENDLFGDTDQNYTNGIKLSLVSSDLTKFRDTDKLLPWVDWWANLLFVNDDVDNDQIQRNIAFSIGQKIFTPQDIDEKQLISDDRPYAGWLYFGTAFHTKTAERLDTLELQLGLVGPYSLAEEAQNFVHDLRDIATAKGWDNQLENEPAFAVIYEQKHRYRPDNFYDRWGYDVIGHVGGAVGTVYTYANAGAELRIGWNIPADFGTSLIRPGGDTNAPIDNSDPRLSNKQDFSVHAFAAVTGRAVLRDIFLDGNTFSNSHDVDKRYWVGDFVIGASAIYEGIKFSYAQVFRTREFANQSDSHNFGSISISFTF
ncbi:MAG: lipid A deacylase LpxR family protein [Gammaproteobacteria bacterium]